MDLELDSNNDGIDHINVYSKGRTELGRFLTNFAFSPITLKDHESFNSIEGYWYWLSTNHRYRYKLKSLHGFAAKKLGEEFKKTNSVRCEQFEKLIKEAIEIKIRSNPKYMEMLRESNLPLEHYYCYGGKVVDAGFKWITAHISEIRQHLQNERCIKA